MLGRAKLATLGLLRGVGALEAVANSKWRRSRLLILCYHGISLDDEHQWRPALYLPPELLEQRLQTLRECVVPYFGWVRPLSALKLRNFRHAVWP